ncbi:MAG: alkaline phosphatase family protein [Planctomycetota bacterium]
MAKGRPQLKLLVLLAVGLRPRDLARAPRIAAVAERGFAAPLVPVLPALTCSVQATFLTGTPPSSHGIVANGWYFRDLAQVMMWRQSNGLVAGEKLYETASRRDPSFTCAKLFWWYNMYAAVKWCVTPRPEYYANGLKRPGLYSEPPELARTLEAQRGGFPLFNFWGPAADIRSTRWIVDASIDVIAAHDPSLLLAYLPHLDYDHQRFGPDGARAQAAVGDLDREAGRLIDAAMARGAAVVVLSEYGIEAVREPIYVNRWLHERGYLRVQETSHGQLLDCGASRAFAVADHQIAHVYVREVADIAPLQRELSARSGVAQVLDRSAQRAHAIDHPRSGELVLVAAPGCWFAYHYWLDESRRPDFATTVDIHRKPGYDPTELFIDPQLKFPRARVAATLLKKSLGFRYLMNVIGTDASIVRGSHGRLFENPDAGPVFICSEPDAPASRVNALDVRERLLRLVFR